MAERTVTMTQEDVRFVEQAKEHYRIFAEAADRQRQDNTAGIMRRQEFYAERFLLRIHAATPGGTNDG